MRHYPGTRGPMLPFNLQSPEMKDRIINSEAKHECWFIENPVSKELTKRITLKLGPHAKQDFIIVVRSPQSKKPLNLMSLVNIGLLQYADEQFGVRESFEDFLRVQYDNSMKAFLQERKRLAQV